MIYEYKTAESVERGSFVALNGKGEIYVPKFRPMSRRALRKKVAKMARTARKKVKELIIEILRETTPD